jgi:hypothetical protein
VEPDLAVSLPADSPASRTAGLVAGAKLRASAYVLGLLARA